MSLHFTMESTMSQAQLEMPVDIEFSHLDPEDVRIYQAVFSSLEMFPWTEYDPSDW